jgi:hypothetical protein
MGFFSSLLGVVFGGKGSPTRHYRASKIDKINRWKAGKKASGKWLPHDEYVKRKRR